MEDHHGEGAGLKGFTRPRYFYGQLLDVRHFESEQEYFKRKLWMLNRTVSGYGVVCGLDVQVGDDDQSVVVLPGLALDRQGREIVVPWRSKKMAIEPMPAETEKKEAAKDSYKDEGPCADDWVHLVICYDECRTDPEPVLAGGCDEMQQCAPGAVRESYELRLEYGKAPDISVDSSIPNLIKGNCINYRALVEWVSTPCDEQSNPCVTLANIHRPSAGRTVELSDIHISVRPIVYSLDLLWELLLALGQEPQNRRTGKH